MAVDSDVAAGHASADAVAPQAGSDAVDASYTVLLMREIGKVLSETQVAILRKRCGDDVKAAGDIYRALQHDGADGNDANDTAHSVDDTALAGSTEDIAYRDEFWDKMERQWRLEQRKNKSGTDGSKLDGSILVVRQRFTEKMMPCETLVDIRGAKLKNVMRNIYREAEGVNLAGDIVTLAPEYFFWARHHLRSASEHAAANKESKTLSEIEVALKFIRQYWPRNKADEMIAKGVISFDHLWAILPPNTLVVGRHVLDDLRVYNVKHHMLYKRRDGTICRRLTSDYGEYDGKMVGLALDHLQIESFPGSVPITQLPYVPLHMHPERERIWDAVLARTKKQFSLFERPFQVQEHEGLGLIHFRDHDFDWVQPQKHKFAGRVMIDPAQMTKAEPDMLIPKLASLRKQSDVQISRSSPDGKLLSIDEIMKVPADDPSSDDKVAGGKLQDFDSIREEQFTEAFIVEASVKRASENPSKASKLAYEDLTEDQLILFSGLVHGYSLADARWGAFSVLNVSDVDWNHGAFESLVMEPELKELVCRLVQAHHLAAIDNDDFVRGKGKGLIGLLFGKPGLGKTLTAEAIAETSETPLFMISSGTLGYDADKISEQLTKMLELAAHWRAVLLLDEADVFLACRQDNDLERNAIVSVFLRQLEYYQGILIMTTNRAETIDPAFQSRIHFCYQYPDLDKDARRCIWQTFLDKTKADGTVKLDFSTADVDELAGLEHNGREIKNVHSIAVKLAAVSDDKTLTKSGVTKAIRMLQNFTPGPNVS